MISELIKMNEKRKRIKKVLILKRILLSMQKRHYITTNCLISPCESSWTRLYMTGNDINIIMNNTNFKEKLTKKHSNRDNEYNVPHAIYQEYTGYKYIKEFI